MEFSYDSKMHNTNLTGELPAALFSIPQLQNVSVYQFVDSLKIKITVYAKGDN